MMGFGTLCRAIGLLLMSLAVLSRAPLCAEVIPASTTGDSHIQSVAYDPQEVILLHVAPGFATTVVFSPDERIETVTVGESSAWQVQVNKRADQMVVKPLGTPASTNLTVISDQRIYNFLLTTLAPDFGVAPYLVRITYPSPPQNETVETQPPRPLTVYRLSGARDLRPTAMSDDDRFTSIEWSVSAPMPAVYSQDTSGHLALVNGIVRDGVYVIEGVFAKLVFVRGAARAQAMRIESGGAKP